MQRLRRSHCSLISARWQALLRLLAAGRHTALQLAASVGVAARTVYRDIQSLRQQGYAIGSAAGRCGGLWLRADSKPLPLHLAGSEVRALLLAVVHTSHRGRLAAVQDAWLLSSRLLGCLPRSISRGFTEATSQIPLRPSVRCPSDALEAFEQGVSLRRLVWITSRQKGAMRARGYVVEPERLDLVAAGWAMVGWDRRSQRQVQLPVHDVVQCRLTPRPVGFSPRQLPSGRSPSVERAASQGS